MRNENSIYYLDEINYDDFNIINPRGYGHKNFSTFQHLPKLFPENIDVYCPGCSNYLTPEGQNLVNSSTAPNLYEAFLGTPFFNPATNTFNNFVNQPYKFNPHKVNHFLHRPMFLNSVTFTPPILARNSSELFL